MRPLTECCGILVEEVQNKFISFGFDSNFSCVIGNQKTLRRRAKSFKKELLKRERAVFKEQTMQELKLHVA